MSLHLSKYLVIVISILIFVKVSSGQQEEKIVILEHADSLIGKVINGENVRELIGDVQFSQGNVTVNCDRAIQYFNTNQIILSGNIKVSEDTLVIFGNRGVYNSEEKTAEAFEGINVEEGKKELSADYAKYFVDEQKIFFKGNVLVRDTSALLLCDQLTYYRTDKRTIAEKNVRIYDLKSDFTTYSHYFNNIGDYSYLTKQPQVFQIDTSSDGIIDTLRIAGIEMHSYQDTLRRFSVIGDVIIKRSTVTAEAGDAVYYTDYDSIILRSKPIIWYDEMQISGDSIFIKITERKLEKVYIYGHAFAISRSDSIYRNRFDQMSGENITLNFNQGEISNIIVDITATSLYYLYEENKAESDTSIIVRKPNGINRTTGDKIIITFEDKNIDNIKVIGGIEGKYFPDNLVNGKESEYNLEGFNWREEKPKIPEFPFSAYTQKQLIRKGNE